MICYGLMPSSCSLSTRMRAILPSSPAASLVIFHMQIRERRPKTNETRTHLIYNPASQRALREAARHDGRRSHRDAVRTAPTVSFQDVYREAQRSDCRMRALKLRSNRCVECRPCPRCGIAMHSTCFEVREPHTAQTTPHSPRLFPVHSRIWARSASTPCAVQARGRSRLGEPASIR